ncbi:hypothetical protein [Kutzneria kofuensis]|uniref:hypothetical protein n=1 Tax=Kutzneria kofuensis TaxID=103725 RepID=UPI0031EB464F
MSTLRPTTGSVTSTSAGVTSQPTIRASIEKWPLPPKFHPFAALNTPSSSRWPAASKRGPRRCR